MAGHPDINLLNVKYESITVDPKWELVIPWSKDGLGGADKYLGMLDIMLPEFGGATPPDKIQIGPDSTIAVSDRGVTKLYNQDGTFQGQRQGDLQGFMPDGSVLTCEGALILYDSEGKVLWERSDPFKDIYNYVTVEEGQPVDGGFEFYTVPTGEIFMPYYIHLRQAVTGEIHQTIQGTVVYDSTGQILNQFTEYLAQPSVFTPMGTVFSAPITLEKGYAHREFFFEQGKTSLKRTIYLPSPQIKAVRENCYLCYDGYEGDNPLISRYAIYKENSNKALTFLTPIGHWFVESAPNVFYTSVTLEEGLKISCWDWSSY